MTAAIGPAAGAGLPILATLATGIYLLVALVTSRLPRSITAISVLRVRHPDGRGQLRDILRQAIGKVFIIDDVQAETVPASNETDAMRMVDVTLHVHGRRPVSDLAASLSDLDTVHAVLASDAQRRRRVIRTTATSSGRPHTGRFSMLGRGWRWLRSRPNMGSRARVCIRGSGGIKTAAWPV